MTDAVEPDDPGADDESGPLEEEMDDPGTNDESGAIEEAAGRLELRLVRPGQ